MKTYEAIESLVELNDFNARKLYKEYIESYLKIHKHANKIRKEYSGTRNKEKMNYRQIVYDAEKEIMETILMIEEYLPYEDRYYSIKKNDEFVRLIFDKSSVVGYVPYENEQIDVEEIVQNKILQEELFRMMKELLTDKQYQCVYMYYFNKMKQEEIAVHLDIEQPNVVNYINNAINKIRKSEYFTEFVDYIT